MSRGLFGSGGTPIDLNQSMPRSRMCVTQHSVSTLLTTVGLRNAPFDGRKRRLDPRPGPLAFQAFDQARLFAADVRPAPRCKINVERKVAAQNVLAQQVVGVAFSIACLQDAKAAAVFVTQIEVGRGRPRRAAGDDDAFEQLMRILLHQDAIVERARLALVGVDAHVDRAGMVLRQERPLQAAREAGAAAAAQAGVLDELRDVGRATCQRLRQTPGSRRPPDRCRADGIGTVRLADSGPSSTGSNSYGHWCPPAVVRCDQFDRLCIGVMSPWHSSSTSRHGAPSHMPRHSANSIVTLPSAVVSPGFTPSLLAKLDEQFFAAAEHAAHAAADPQPMLAERLALVAKEAVEAQRVVHFGRVQLQQLGDFLDRRRRHAPQLVLHDVQRRQRDRLLVRIARSSTLDLSRFIASWPACIVSAPRRSSIQLRGNDVQAAQHGHHVAQLVAHDQVRKHREMNERRRPRPGAVGPVRAVGDDVETQFAVGRFRRPVHFLDRRRHAAIGHHQLEVMNQPFDALIDSPSCRAAITLPPTSAFTGPAGIFSIACSTILRLSSISSMRTM